jgi:hypothetical protein
MLALRPADRTTVLDDELAGWMILLDPDPTFVETLFTMVIPVITVFFINIK